MWARLSTEVWYRVRDGPQTVFNGVYGLVDKHLPKLKLHEMKKEKKRDSLLQSTLSPQSLLYPSSQYVILPFLSSNSSSLSLLPPPTLDSCLPLHFISSSLPPTPTSKTYPSLLLSLLAHFFCWQVCVIMHGAVLPVTLAIAASPLVL